MARRSDLADTSTGEKPTANLPERANPPGGKSRQRSGGDGEERPIGTAVHIREVEVLGDRRHHVVLTRNA
jgi:hypothetical protein